MPIFAAVNALTLYHGSNVVVEKPQIVSRGFNKDFGFGFYCTEKEKQAVKWAATKRDGHVVNIYDYQPDESLKMLVFPKMSEEWLDFVVLCRSGAKHDYDIVEGPMADDTIWDYVEDYIEGNISREAFWVLSKFKYPTHQILFATERSLKTLTFKKSYNV